MTLASHWGVLCSIRRAGWNCNVPMGNDLLDVRNQEAAPLRAMRCPTAGKGRQCSAALVHLGEVHNAPDRALSSQFAVLRRAADTLIKRAKVTRVQSVYEDPSFGAVAPSDSTPCSIVLCSCPWA